MNMLVTFEKVENWEMYCLNSCTNSFIHTLFLTAPVEQWIVEWRNCKNPARLITNYVPDFDERDSTKHANILLAWTWLRFLPKLFSVTESGSKAGHYAWFRVELCSWGKRLHFAFFWQKVTERTLDMRWINMSAICSKDAGEKKNTKKSQTMYQTVQRIK